MAAFPASVPTHSNLSSCIDTSCEFIRALMKLQRATSVIASTLDLDALLDRVVNEIASSIGDVEVSVWLRADDADEMVLRGVRGNTSYKKGDRMQIGRQGMVGHAAATGKMHYAPDVREDPYYIACKLTTRSEVSIPLKTAGRVIGVLSIDHHEPNAFSSDQLKVLQALATLPFRAV
jgi:sigma-B regulation protein RsbU (phosphoserine phosphatase)